MKKFLPLLFLTTTCFLENCFAQGAPAWERPLVICYSTNGINFTPPVTFQDSSGVPSVCMDSTGKLIAAFQWFPAPMHGLHWDSVAVKISLNDGLTWSDPQPIVVQNLPLNFQRPFDPTVVALPGGQIRIYFSSGPPGLNTIATYSAIGTDGIHYTFEPGIRFSQPGRNVIDPAVTIFMDTFQYTAPKGAPQDGAFHATSTDGLNFSQLPDIISDSSHQWTGNLVVDSLAMKFYGTGAMGTNIWMRSTANGNIWAPYLPTNIAGGDPAVVKIAAGIYVMIFTGMHSPSSINDPENMDALVVYPNPANQLLVIRYPISGSDARIKIFDLAGREISEKIIEADKGKIVLDVTEWQIGIYFLQIESDKKIVTKKISIIK